MPCLDAVQAEVAKGEFDEEPPRLGAVTVVPVGNTDPIAHLGPPLLPSDAIEADRSEQLIDDLVPRAAARYRSLPVVARAHMPGSVALRPACARDQHTWYSLGEYVSGPALLLDLRCPRASEPRRWAVSNLELAFCYANRREANPTANMREALRLLDAALEILTADRYPEDFALACSRKANLLLDMGSSSDPVTRSVSAFQSALTVYSKESYPDDWALVLSNMATAYLGRGGYTGVDDLRQAIDLMEQVVRVRTRQNAPESWAVTQMNLGLALSRLPTSDPCDPAPAPSKRCARLTTCSANWARPHASRPQPTISG